MEGKGDESSSNESKQMDPDKSMPSKNETKIDKEDPAREGATQETSPATVGEQMGQGEVKGRAKRKAVMKAAPISRPHREVRSHYQRPNTTCI